MCSYLCTLYLFETYNTAISVYSHVHVYVLLDLDFIDLYMIDHLYYINKSCTIFVYLIQDIHCFIIG